MVAMDIADFRASLDQQDPPATLDKPLAALWYDAQGDWNRAHTLAQEQENTVGYWIHAYLHRVEGDNRNASYWYNRAGKTPSAAPLKQEWEEIASALL